MADPDSPPSVSSDRTETRKYAILPDEHLAFIQNIPQKVKMDHYDEIEILFDDYYIQNLIKSWEFELAILEMIKDYPNAVEQFKNLFPTATMIPTPGAGVDPDKTVFVRTGGFMDRVRAGLLHVNTPFYMDWLTNLQKYNEGSMSYKEFKFKVAALFVEHPDLYDELDLNIDKGRTDQTDDEYSTSTETEVSSTMPDPKRRKTS